jgi:2,4-dienoyl-CoA reductase-like NADH-dependent reductase (Old Yellow Enzyme family)
MSPAFPNLFSPLRIGPLMLKNRLAVSPHGIKFAATGRLTEAYVAYELEKAKGGAGLIIMSYGLADPTAEEGLLISTWRKENIPLFRELVAGVHEYGSRIFFQFGESQHHSGMGASANPFTGRGSGGARPMTLSDIRRAMDFYAASAETLMEAGLDGIEMHGHGDLFSDFLSPAINRRTDEYGGSFENRARYFLQAAKVIRDAVGRDQVLGARVSVDDLIPNSVPLEEGVRIARHLADSGLLDYLNVDVSYEPENLPRMIPPMYAEPGYQLYASAAVKRVVSNIPIMAVGRITRPEVAERALAESKADIVAMARAMIADPEFANKAREGRVLDIRYCLGDNQDCVGRIQQNLAMRCTVNPVVGREAEWGIGRLGRTARVKRVVVVGGGPGGAEAARVAALRGHEVVLYEKNSELGGQVRLARLLPGRSDIGSIISWHAHQLEQLGVDVRRGVEATAAVIEASAPDAVIVATGARWLRNGLTSLDFAAVPGWEEAHVFAPDAAVEGAAASATRVVIYDAKGFIEGPGLAEMLVAQGKAVELVTPFGQLGSAELHNTHQWPWLMERILGCGVVLTTSVQVSAIKGSTVTLRNIHTKTEVVREGVDAVVMVTAREPVDDLHRELEGRIGELYRVGDCNSPLNIGQAIRSGFGAAVRL